MNLRLFAAATLVWFAVVPLAAAPPEAPAFKLSVEEDGVYRLGFEQLVEAGWSGGALPVAGLGLSLAGAAVPISITGAEDGRFGPGDHFEFIGRHPRGENSYFDPDLTANVYQLKTGVTSPARFLELSPPGAVSATAEVIERQHLERDDLQLRFSKLRGKDPEAWYWVRTTSADREPVSIGIDLAGRDPSSALPVSLKVALRGWSWQRAEQRESPDHSVEIAWNGTVLGTVEWTGQEEAIFETPAVPAEALAADSHRLTLKVVPRTRKDGSAILDVAVLNWIEVGFPRRPEVPAGGQLALEVARPGVAALAVRAAEPLVLLSEAGERSLSRVAGDFQRLTLPEKGGFFLYSGASRVVPEVRLDTPSRLADTSNRADYLMIAHASLKAAAEPLAEFHRQRGLKVELIDVEDIFDEFGYGLPRAAAIKAFVAHAYQSWTKPAPRFVLLVGDASWDPRASEEEAGERTYVDWAYGPRDGLKFRQNHGTSYTKGAGVSRNLIPTGSYQTSQGHAASDNYFVAMESFDRFPDLAIGRFPVVEPEEVTAIVDKTLRYMKEPELGGWRSRLLWITNEEAELQAQGDELARQWATQGYSSTRVYPQANGEANATHQAGLRRAFDDGYALVHFHGHGGRYIWRTAAPDYQKNADLFTLEDLDKLAPNRRLPVVLSMTCYSAPFDHPTADSIGEKFLRLAGRGAVAVFAASWRNSPDTSFSKALVEEILAAKTLGEGVQRAKHRASTLPMIEQYNLLGDPALELARPSPTLTLEAFEPQGRRIAGKTKSPGFQGEVDVSWLGQAGEVLASRKVKVADGAFAAELNDEEAAKLAFRGGAWVVAAYAVAADGRGEALGALDLRPPSGVAAK